MVTFWSFMDYSKNAAAGIGQRRNPSNIMQQERPTAKGCFAEKRAA
jgi:hypothetical protein